LPTGIFGYEPGIPFVQIKIRCTDIGYLFNLIYDRSPARLGRGDQWVALIIGCPQHMGVTLIWPAPAGHRGREWLKRGLSSSK